MGRKKEKKRSRPEVPAGGSELAELAEKREELTRKLIKRAEDERETLAKRIGELDAELGALTRQRRDLEERLRGLGVRLESEPEPEDYAAAYRKEKREREALERERDELKARLEAWEDTFFPRVDERYAQFIREEVEAGRLRFYLLVLAEEQELDPESASDVYNTSFDRVLLITDTSFENSFDFRLEETYDAQTGFPVRRRLDTAIFVCVGWLTNSIPILLKIATTRSADKYAQIHLDAERLRDIREEVLMRMVMYYRGQMEQAAKAITAAEAIKDAALDEYDKLVGEFEEIAGDWFEQPPGLKQVIEVHEHNKRSKWAMVGAVLAAAAIALLAVVL